MISIFNYLDYRVFLKECRQRCRKDAPYFSLRWLSGKIGLKSNGFLPWVVSGKKNLTTTLALSIAKALKFGKRESDYFLALVHYNQARTAEEQSHFFEELLSLRPVASKKVAAGQTEFYRQWYHAAIRELCAIFPVSDDYSLVVKRLTPSVKPCEVKAAVELLVRIGMIRKGKAGTYERCDPVLTSNGSEVDSAAVRGYQEKMLDLAKSALHAIPKQKRDISTVTLSIDEAGLEKIRKRGEAFRTEALSIALACEKPDRVAQLNVQLFPLTNDISGKGNA